MAEIEEYNRILNSQLYMALATSGEGLSNVRVMNYFPDPYQPNVLYIRTNQEKPKVAEFQRNPRVSFATIIQGRYEYIRVQDAQIKRVKNHQAEGVKAAFMGKDPKFLEKMQKADSPYLYSITFTEASVTVNPVDAALKIHFPRIKK